MLADFWASFELVQRSTLVGWVLLIGADKAFVRVVAANFVLAFTLLCTSLSAPYRRRHDNMLAVAAMLLMHIIYLWATLLKLFENLQEEGFSLGDSRLATRVLGFTSIDEVLFAVSLLATSLFGFLLFSIGHQRRTSKWVHTSYDSKRQATHRN